MGFSPKYFAILGNIVINTFIIKVLGMNVLKSFNHFDKLFT